MTEQTQRHQPPLEPDWQRAFERTLVHMFDVTREREEIEAERDRLRAALDEIGNLITCVLTPGERAAFDSILHKHGLGGCQ